jgi:hypothetical protein
MNIKLEKKIKKNNNSAEAGSQPSYEKRMDVFGILSLFCLQADVFVYSYQLPVHLHL